MAQVVVGFGVHLQGLAKEYAGGFAQPKSVSLSLDKHTAKYYYIEPWILVFTYRAKWKRAHCL